MNSIDKIDIKIIQKRWDSLREKLNNTVKNNNKGNNYVDKYKQNI